MTNWHVAFLITFTAKIVGIFSNLIKLKIMYMDVIVQCRLPVLENEEKIY